MPVLMSLHGHPGHEEGEVVTLIPGLENLVSERRPEPSTVVLTSAGALLVVPSCRCKIISTTEGLI